MICERIGSRLILLIILFVTAVEVASAGENNMSGDTLALVNGKPITAYEFKKRFDLSIYPGKETFSGIDAVKEKFLLSMVAEMLLADEGIKSGKYMNSEAQQLEKSAVDTYLRDALYREEVLSKVQITNEMVRQALVNAGYVYKVEVFHFRDSTNAALFYHQCSRLDSASLNAVAVMNRIFIDTVTVRYGNLLENQEEAFWGREAGFVTEPIRGQGQFIVIKVLERNYDPEFSKLSNQQKEITVRKLLQTRYEILRTENYVGNLFGRIRVRINPSAMSMLADSLASILRMEVPTYIGGVYLLNRTLTIDLLDKLNDNVNLPLLKIYRSTVDKNPQLMLLGTAINGLEGAQFRTTDTTRESVMLALRTALRRVVEYHLLAVRARDSGFANLPEVRDNVEMIMRSYFADKMRKAITDTVKLSDEDISKFMRDYRSSELSKVDMVLEEFHLPTIDAAVKAFEALNRERNAVDTIAIAMATKVDTLRRNAYLFGSTGIAFLESQPGAIYGPVQKGGEFVLYRLISRATTESDSLIINEKNLVKQIALEKKKNDVIAKYVADLADKANVRIFVEALKRVKVEPVQMFVVRNIGFGGKINAVPALIQCEDWPKEAKSIRKIIVP
ncbi:MAG: hypothetical protein ACP5MI_00930 [Candidatus Kryptoniota bacterium]